MQTRMTRARVFAAGVIWLSLIATSTAAQDLDPRAYAQAPTGLTVAIAGVSFSSAMVLTDLTVPAENAHADVLTPSVGSFGRTAQGIDARKVQNVELRFFGGLTVDETAEVLGISPVTVRRGWRAAKIPCWQRHWKHARK